MTPDIPSLVTSDQPSSEGRFTLRTLGTDFVFSGGDYEYLKAIDDDQGQRCEVIGFTITSICNGVTITHFEGKIDLSQCEFIPKECRVITTPVPDNARTCFLDEYGEEYNILKAATKYTVRPFIGEVVFAIAGFDPQVNIFPDNLLPGAGINDDGGTYLFAEAWGVYYNVILNATPTSPSFLYDADVQTIWVREEAIGYGPSSPPGGDWVNLGGNDWARPVQLVPSSDPINSGPVIISGNYTGQADLNSVVGLNVDGTALNVSDPNNFTEARYGNGVDLKDAIEYLLGEMNCQVTAVRSDFYRVNAVDVPMSAPYVQAREDFDKFILWNITDVSKWDATNNATIADVSMKDILESLRATHNVDWTIETIGGVDTLRIEHESYFIRQQSIDLLTEYPSDVEGRTSYKYRSEGVPRKERFQWASDSSEFFKGEPIVYGSGCATGDSKTFSASTFFSDLGYIWQNTDSISTGFLFIGAAQLLGGQWYFMKNAEGYNDPLAFTYLLPSFWTFGRPYPEGTMNGVSTVFDTALRTKEQEQISLAMALNTYGQDFDGGGLFNTSFGWGEVLSAEYDHKTNLLTLNLRHDS